MADHAAETGRSKGRQRGGALRISRDGIIEAARGLDPQTLTMQAVADRLGVDRKALHYHVTDRDGLMRLLAADVFERTCAEAFQAHFDEAASGADDDWGAALRTWAVTVCDSIVTVGADHTSFPLESDSVRVLEPAELVLQRMLRAGFDLATAGRGLGCVTAFARGIGRDKLAATQHGRNPEVAEVRGLLAQDAPGDDFAALRGLALLGVNEADDIDAQLEFGIDILIMGLARHLADPDRSGRPGRRGQDGTGPAPRRGPDEGLVPAQPAM